MDQKSEKEQYISEHMGYSCSRGESSGSEECNRFVDQISDNGEFVSNHSGYDYPGSENFEHDDNGCTMNFSGCYDQVMGAFITNECWMEGYDF